MYSIKIDKTEGVEKVLKGDITIVNDRYVNVSLNEEDVPDTITKLVKNGYKIYEVKEMEMSLEEAFLKRTGGNIID